MKTTEVLGQSETLYWAGPPNSNAAESPQHLSAKPCLCPAHPSTTDERQRNGTVTTDVESEPLLLVWFGF